MQNFVHQQCQDLPSFFFPVRCVDNLDSKSSMFQSFQSRKHLYGKFLLFFMPYMIRSNTEPGPSNRQCL